MNGVFVGRTRELERVSTLEPASAVVVLGDAGSGKSRLLAEATAGSDLRVVRVLGYEPERRVPLAAASGLLREVAAETAFDAPAEPVRVFEAAHRGLAGLGPVLLVVDDVQWVDELSLALLHYVVRADPGSRAVLAAGRPSAATAALAEDLVRILPAERVEILELAPLGRDEGVELARALDPALAEADAAALWERSEGLPFWIEALVRAGGERVEADRLLASRLRGADADATSLLALLAVLGRPLSATALAAAIRWPGERAEAAADALVARGLASRPRGAVAIAHDLVREAAYAELPDDRRRSLHARVSDWLLDTAGDDVAALREAFEHRTAAGLPAHDLALRLVSSPQRRRLGRDGLTAIATLADEWPEAPTDLREGLARLAADLGEHADAVERWCALALAADEPARRADSYLHASKAAFELGPALPGRARELLELARADTPDGVADVRLRAHEARVLLWLEHDTPAGAAVARDAVERSERLGSGDAATRATLESLRAAFEAAMQEDRGETMLALADRLLAAAQSSDARTEALISRGLAQRFVRPVAEAAATFRAAAELAERSVLPAQGVDAGFWLAQCLHDAGDLGEAERVALQAAELAARVGDVSRVRAHVKRIRDRIALADGRQEEGLAGLAAEASSETDPHYRLGSLQAAAQHLARTSGEKAASQIVELLTAAESDAEASGCPRCTNELRLSAVAALARAGRPAEAATQLALAEPGREGGVPTLWLLSANALLAAANGADDAVAGLEEACRLAAASERGLDELWLRIDLARALVPADRERAAAELRGAAARADELGALTIRGVAEQELRRLGVRTWRRGRSRVADGTLSEREREVADLVARGASNPEIAQALFLSRKTVERHVSNVLAKLGARNRAELAAFLARESEGSPR